MQGDFDITGKQHGRLEGAELQPGPPSNRISFVHKREGQSNKCSNMVELRKHYAKSEEPGPKGPILYDFIQMRCPEEGGIQRQRGDSGSLEVGHGRPGYRPSLPHDENVLE